MAHVVGIYGIATISVSCGLLSHHFKLTIPQTAFMTVGMMMARDFVVMAAALIAGH